MVEFGEVLDLGDVHEVLKRGVGRVEIVGSMVKIGWISYSDAAPERKIVALDIWDHDELMEAYRALLHMIDIAIKQAGKPEKAAVVLKIVPPG